jgi:hypothetical protein
MGVFDGIRNRLRRNKETELSPMPEDIGMPKPAAEFGEVAAENVKAKLDLMATRLDSISTQYAAMNERIKNIERLAAEIRSFCK